MAKPKGSKLEATLVSMAGTFMYLHDMVSTLNRKPLVPRAVEPLMAATMTELDTLKAQFEASRQAALKDAQPLLDEWLSQVGLTVGGVIRGVSWRRALGSTRGATLTFEGGIANARLHHFALDGARVVDFTLDGAQLRLPSGQIARTVADIPVRAESMYNLTALKDIETKDARTGEASPVLHVRVPLQAVQREQWMRNGNLELA
ncbi:hypothetical protein WJ96_06290 [Burkholderia ubonensis]|uniref:Uncharacterized protein n=1 Tax=Burkholderia ubonensis TaxID=101571 RepID=A0AAW3MW63_9BURK|nr:hypothetical protein [Burkholderia ubonensis]KVP75367.1 hypothetical protein WJ93_08095 [Burkholderia ubonensis]KVP96832.1 hypothetical protein WJ97_13210 [Burkholderia ubonensis]KVP98178.1 hypothetical protein WJ96_06290 [Burkholderia ubonensis]KVZ92876.1 hypothetical protein WL25_17955 [Burkholderia ubonensis]